MADRVALYLQDDYSLPTSIDYARYAETRGFETVWQAEARLVRDSLITLAAYAPMTHRIKLGSGVMNIWSRNVATMAAELLTLEDLAPDRIVCGLGSWYDPLAAQVGVKRNKNLLAMREVLITLRRLLQLERLTYYGEFVHLQDIALDVTQGRREPRRIPFYIGATGPKMLALAGEIADGVLLNYLVTPAYTEMAVSQLEIGTRKAQRLIDDIDRPQLIICSVNDDRRRALNNSRRLIAQYIVQQPQMMRANGISQGLIDELRQVIPPSATPEQLEHALHLVPDNVVQLVTASGTPQEVRAKVREYIYAGATSAVLYPLGGDVRYLIDTFATGYTD